MIKFITGKAVFGIFAIALFVVTFESAQASSYFIRPFIQEGSLFIDGLEVNGATVRSETLGGKFDTEVNLEQGTVKALTIVDDPGQFGQSGGSFGERVSFGSNAVGTLVDFAFDVEGQIAITDLTPGTISSILNITVSTGLFVFDASAGATATNFTSLGGELIGDTDFDNSFSLNPGDVITEFDEEIILDVSSTLANSIFIDAPGEFDVFAFLSVSVAMNQNDATVVMDFLSTGQLDLATAQGVTYTSSSGVFLDSVGVTPAVVPVPAALPLFGTGLAVMGFIGWRRKRKVSA